MQPSIGRIVHFKFHGDTAALIVNINEDSSVDLQVFHQNGSTEFVQKVIQGSEFGQWNWPTRV
ncbi:hypothetical protein KIH86_08475 [Paenibacillus sp. HN-1]|uniref:hypothetical protein n=1 Tax=Paenibacillus TaxID=44249 RepID=UPI000F9A01ED|nr:MULTISPECIES: hypothetical protein [Paenibacillus]MBY9079585.1 hypothetical protein [Paenibacillus sp. CGMCC 1.18879]MBY9084274.1 hypothetical protein [Paenibacillus sinensis]